MNGFMILTGFYEDHPPKGGESYGDGVTVVSGARGAACVRVGLGVRVINPW